MKTWIKPLIALLILLLVAMPSKVSATTNTTHKVEVDDNYFEPKTITIRVGDTVEWENEGQNPHTVTADDGSFDSGNLNSGDSFSHTFTKAGKYAYYCKYHGAAGGVGMAGTVVVMSGPAQTGAGGMANRESLLPILLLVVGVVILYLGLRFKYNRIS